MKFLILLLLLAKLSSQNIPLWLEAQLDAENSEILLEEMESLRASLPRNTPLSALSPQLYFVPDSILKSYLTNPKHVSAESARFLDQFFISTREFSSFMLFRSTANADSAFGEKLGSKHKVKTHYRFAHGALRAEFFTAKTKYEEFGSTLRGLVSYDFSSFHVAAGNMRLRGVNPLIFATQFGEPFYERSFRREPSLRVAAQSSLNMQHVLHGAAAVFHPNKKLRFLFAAGRQNYAVTAYNGGFRSISFYQPETEKDQFSDKLSIDETTLLAEGEFAFSKNWHASVSVLSNTFSRPFEISTDYGNSAFKRATFFGVETSYTLPNATALLRSGAMENRGAAHEFFLAFKAKKSRADITFFNYAPDFNNFKSNAASLGSRRAENLRGFSLQSAFQFSARFRPFAGVLKHEEIRADSREAPIQKTMKSFFGFDGRWSRLWYKVKVKNRASEQAQLSLRYRIKQRFYVTAKQFWYGKFKQSYSLVQLDYNRLKFGFGAVQTDEAIQVYQPALYREFLTASFKEDELFFFIKGGVKFAAFGSLEFIWQSRIRENANFIDTTTERIHSNWNNEFALSYFVEF